MIAKQNRYLVVLFLFMSLYSIAQHVGIYKTNDLLKRIYNKSDTIYIVNFWATWCKPCIAELPAFEKINSESTSSTSATKVKVLLVTMDFKEDLKRRVMPFLKTNHYLTEVVLLDEINGNEFINKIAPEWTGAIPATIVTKNNKSRFEYFEKKVTYEFLKGKLSE